MSESLLISVGPTASAFYEADQKLNQNPTSENLQLVKKAMQRYRDKQKEQYPLQDWDHNSLKAATRMASECWEAYELWLKSVEEEIKSGTAVATKLLLDHVVVNPISPAPELPSKTKDRPFF